MSTEEPVASDNTPQPAGDTPAQTPDMSGIEAKLDTMSEQLGAAQAALTNPDYLEFQQQKRLKELEDLTDPPSPVSNPAEEEVNYDMLSNADLVARMRAERVTEFTSLRSRHEAELKGLTDERNKERALFEIQRVYDKYPEFEKSVKTDKDFRARLGVLVQQNPTWGAEQLRQQMAMEKSWNDQKAAETEKERANQDLLAITEQGGLPGSSLTPNDLTNEQAVDIAFRQIYGEGGNQTP